MTDTLPFLPYGRQDINDDDVAAVCAALAGDYLTTGPTVTAFENEFAALAGANHAIACSSGTAALHLASMTLDLRPGDAVIVPTLTFLATASAPHLCGASVIFADVDPDTGLMRAADLRNALERAQRSGLRVRAVLPVHLNGRCVASQEIAAVLEPHCDVVVIEDACHALGGTDAQGKPVGSCAHATMSAFSLHPVKSMTTGEGGMVTCNDGALADRLRLLCNHGMTRDPNRFRHHHDALAPDGQVNPWYYELHAPGLNYRITDVASALGRTQLQRLGQFMRQRAALVRRYRERLRNLAHIRTIDDGNQQFVGWHLFVALIDFESLRTSRAHVMHALRARGIGSQVHYLPVHRQPYYRNLAPDLELPGADRYYARCLSLPLFPAMGIDDVDRVVDALTDVLH